MTKTVDIFTARNSFFASLLIAAALLFFLAPKAAVNVDEQLHYPHAKEVVNWYFTGGNDVSCLQTAHSNLKYYGQSVDNFTALVNRIFSIENEFLTRHFTGAFFFWLLLLFAALIAFQITGSFWVATLTVVSMVVMPRLFGQAFGNLKDIPFAAGYSAGVFFIIRFVKELPTPKWSSAIWLGLAIAFTNSVRIGGLILFAYFGLAVIVAIVLKPFLLKYIFSTKLSFVRFLGQGVVIVAIGYFAGLLFWPFALQDIFRNPLESLGVMEHYKVSIRQIFEGNLIWSTRLPWYYLLKWLLLSTPGFILLGFLLSIVFLFRNILKPATQKQLFIELFVFFTLLFPVVYVIIIRSNLYSGVRQMLFVLPLLAVLSSVGIFRFFETNFNTKFKIAVVALFFVSMLFPAVHQVKTFPADYIYFNKIAGGNKKAWTNYEYDYYFHSIKKPAEFLIDLIGEEDVTVAMNCNLSNYFQNNLNIKYRYARYLERSSVDWDYALFGINYIHPFQLKNDTWQSTEIIKTFYHLGNPVAVILKRSNKNDFNAIAEIEKGEIKKGEELLREAIVADPENVWLFVYLAKICFVKNDFSEFDSIIKKGFEIHPFYEPLYLLKAQKLFDEADYKESFKMLQQLIKINPRYKNAAPLLKAVKEKLEL
jgi:hypothetical protein